MSAVHYENTAILGVRLVEYAASPAHLIEKRLRSLSVRLALVQFVRVANRNRQLAARLGPCLDASAAIVRRAKVLGEDGATATV